MKATKEEKTAFDFQPFQVEMDVFLCHLADGTCKDILNPKRSIQCNCRASLGLLTLVAKSATIRYLIGFAMLDWSAQRAKVLEWMRYAEGCRSSSPDTHTVYLLPGSCSYKICRNTLSMVIGFGSTAWRNLLKCLKMGAMVPSHGLSGQKSNHWDWSNYFDMDCFFAELQKEAMPRATKLIRALTAEGTVREELKDDDPDLVELPSCYRKRAVYRTFLKGVGFTERLDNKSRVIERVNNSPFEDAQPPSWTCFRTFWKARYPKLVIQKAAEDICEDCVVFANQHKYNKRRMREALAEESDDEDSDDDEVATGNEVIIEQEQEVVRKATEHVDMARKQRLLFNTKKLQAKADRVADVPPEERTYCYIGDFAQNMYLPNFASEQPGATYYYSPLNVYPFGLVDGSTDPSQLTAHVFYEGTV